MASDQFGSGGGFSAMFDQSNATWQSDVVAKYLQVVPKKAPFPPQGSFPAKGRATPDISALGEGYAVLMNGDVEPVGGTSASTPLFGGLVSLLNEARLQKGGKPLGFLNPFLYKNAAAFNDITTGSSEGCSDGGWPAKEGWDAVTGLGTPNYAKLVQAALDLP